MDVIFLLIGFYLNFNHLNFKIPKQKKIIVRRIKYKNREISDRNTELMSNTYIVVYS